MSPDNEMGVFDQQPDFFGTHATDGTHYLVWEDGSAYMDFQFTSPVKAFGINVTDFGDFGSGTLSFSNNAGANYILATPPCATGTSCSSGWCPTSHSRRPGCRRPSWVRQSASMNSISVRSLSPRVVRCSLCALARMWPSRGAAVSRFFKKKEVPGEWTTQAPPWEQKTIASFKPPQPFPAAARAASALRAAGA